MQSHDGNGLIGIKQPLMTAGGVERVVGLPLSADSNSQKFHDYPFLQGTPERTHPP